MEIMVFDVAMVVDGRMLNEDHNITVGFIGEKKPTVKEFAAVLEKSSTSTLKYQILDDDCYERISVDNLNGYLVNIGSGIVDVYFGVEGSENFIWTPIKKDNFNPPFINHYLK